MPKNRSKVIIIGSGSSINSLSPIDIEYINNNEYTIAMNKFLLFHHKTGIAPKYIFLADRHFPAQKVFFESIAIARTLPTPPAFYVSSYYQHFFQAGLLKGKFGIRERYRLLKNHQYFVPFQLNYNNINYFESSIYNHHKFSWSDSLSDPLFFYRGSLTVAINLSSILFKECDIYLLGIDLNNSTSFFEEELQDRPDLLDKYHVLGKLANMHPTTLPIDGTDGIISVFPSIIHALNERNISLYNCNPHSLLVTEGICEYAPIMSTR